MNLMLSYLMEGSILLFILYAFYRVLLSNLSLFVWNRFYLLLTMTFTLFLPLVSINIFTPILPIAANTYFNLSLPELRISDLGSKWVYSTLSQLFAGIYFIGLFWKLFLLVFGIIKTCLRIKKSIKIFKGNFIISIHPAFQPASFFNYLLLSEYREENPVHQILVLHESEHAAKLHTLDLLLLQVVKAVFWFHPLLRSWESRLQEVHEFQADKRVTAIHPKKIYAQLLLDLISPKEEKNHINHFNQSQIKKRITMMYKTKSNWIQKARILLSLPFLLMILIFFSCEFQEGKILTGAETVNDKQINAIDVLDRAEVLPQFQGGMPGLWKYLSANLNYPAQARRMGIEGKVTVEFVVNAEGKVSEAKVLSGIGAGCDEEALRVVRTSQNWIPGRQNGQDVNARIQLPILFKLNE